MIKTDSTPAMGAKRTILLVDDDASLLQLLSIRLSSEGFDVHCAPDADSAIKAIRKNVFSVVLSDLRMPGKDGLFLLEYLNREFPTLPLIIMTAHGSIDEAITATQNGALGFITKPIDHQKLKAALEKSFQQNAGLENSQWRKNIITQNPAMHHLLEQAYRIAQKDVSVLITGASGTGKEVLAQAIHEASPRKEKPFIAINCGALPEHLLESELFGHAKGAFTGAVTENQGLFRAADGGTLFLDEIGDMPMTLQVKLLRVLQERKVRPVGRSQSIDIDVRVLSATHRDLKNAIANNEFREDLYYRLNVVNLMLPSLKDRAEDIPLLSRHLLAQINSRYNTQVRRFSDNAMHKLCEATWSGNIRQLVNVVEQCVALSTGSIINESLVEQALEFNERNWPTLADAKEDFEHQYLVKVLKMSEGRVARAAKMAGRNRTDFYKLLKRHNLEVQEFRVR